MIVSLIIAAIMAFGAFCCWIVASDMMAFRADWTDAALGAAASAARAANIMIGAAAVAHAFGLL